MVVAKMLKLELNPAVLLKLKLNCAVPAATLPVKCAEPGVMPNGVMGWLAPPGTVGAGATPFKVAWAFTV